MVQADDSKEEAILSHLVGTSLHQAAKRNGVGDGGVRRVLKRRVMGEVPMEVALEGLSEVVLGIDEHSFRGQKMMITVTSLAPVRRLLAILPEGTPTKIKLLKRLSYGFRNAETYIRKMLLGLLPWFLLELTPHLLA
ncbi:MAG: hypothetical protein KM310_07670 [Clostridiales bacterium]|nr:hypothetical protein [Clostridiales bacterium]